MIPGVAPNSSDSMAGSPTSPRKSAITPPSGLFGTSRSVVGATRSKVESSPKDNNSSGIGQWSCSTNLVESAMTTKRSAVTATSFSWVWAPPPPFTNHPSGAI